MKRIFLLLAICLVTSVSFGQKKSNDVSQVEPTAQQMDSAITEIYKSYDADRKLIQEQIQQAEDESFKKALGFQWNALETKCANRIWGYLLSLPQCETTLQMMARLRTTVDKEIVKKTLEQIKDKKLLQTKSADVLSYYVNNEQAKVGEKFIEVEVPALGPEGKALKLSDEVKNKTILLIIGSTSKDELPDTFNVFYKKMDTAVQDIIQVGLYQNQEEATNALAENKYKWPFYAEQRGVFAPIVLDYNVQDTPLCVLIEKGSGKIIYMAVGVTDELMGVMLTH